jgi:hypothetical protein
MRYDPEVHHRRSLRMKGYDYSEPGTYFVTMCVQSGEGVFGRIAGDEVQVNAAGRMVERWWQELTRKYAHVALGEYVVMPNHFHGVVVIMESAPARACAEGAHAGAPRRAGEHGVGAALRGRPLPAPGWARRACTGAHAPARAHTGMGPRGCTLATVVARAFEEGGHIGPPLRGVPWQRARVMCGGSPWR